MRTEAPYDLARHGARVLARCRAALARCRCCHIGIHRRIRVSGSSSGSVQCVAGISSVSVGVASSATAAQARAPAAHGTSACCVGHQHPTAFSTNNSNWSSALVHRHHIGCFPSSAHGDTDGAGFASIACATATTAASRERECHRETATATAAAGTPASSSSNTSSNTSTSSRATPASRPQIQAADASVASSRSSSNNDRSPTDSSRQSTAHDGSNVSSSSIGWRRVAGHVRFSLSCSEQAASVCRQFHR